MKKMKQQNQSGFTLVEVIVVAVIVLILSAVAIPLYNGFIKQAKMDTVIGLAETTAASANTVWRRVGTGGVTDGDVTPNTNPLNVHFDAARHSVKIVGDSIIVSEIGEANADIRAARAFK